MSQMRICPVCGRPGLPPNCGSCPQCDADLTCFQALDSLASPEAVKAAAQPKRRFPWTAAAVLALLFLAGLAASMKSRLSELDHQTAEMKAAEQRAAVNKQKQEPALATAPIEQTPQQPESKIQIDAGVRIVDEGKAAQQSASAQTAGKKTAEEPAQLVVVAVKEQKEIAADIDAKQPAEARNTAAEAVKNVAVPPAGQLEKTDARPKVVMEAIRQPDTDDAPLGAAMPPLLAEKTMEQTGTSQEQPKTKQHLSAFSERPVNEEGRNTAELADLPAKPPVLLKPGFRKRRMRPAHTAAVREGMTQQHPSAVAGNLPPPAAAQQHGGTFSYLVKDGETVWDIAERFYGDRKYYPVVMEQNPHIFLGFIRRNSAVQLFADRREAVALYQRKIEQRDGLLLWSYEARPGETWRSIYARFFLPRYSGMIFYGDQDVAPGKTMRIILR